MLGNVPITPDRKRMRIVVDFDGTLATKSWPTLDDNSVWNDVLATWLCKRRLMGDYISLWTCRENYGGVKFPDHEYLNDAVRFCTKHRFFFDAVNRNVGEEFGEYQLGSKRFGRKVCADVYIDDRSLPFDPEGKLAKVWWRLYLWMLDRKLAKMSK